MVQMKGCQPLQENRNRKFSLVTNPRSQLYKWGKCNSILQNKLMESDKPEVKWANRGDSLDEKSCGGVQKSVPSLSLPVENCILLYYICN